MDDDYFIGQKLEKSDFFYVKDGKVVPSIITADFVKIVPKLVEQNCELYEQKAKMSNLEQNNDVFRYSQYITFSFILKIFNISLNENFYLPKFTHNAIPVNLKEVKEIYDLTQMSKYKYNTLDCKYRIYGYLQFQIFIQSYTFIKYKRKIKHIPNKFIQLYNAISENYNISLFCINKGSGNISYLHLYKAKIAMEYLFPIPSPYEIIDNSILNLSYNIAYTLNKIININHKKLAHSITKKEFFYRELNHILIFILIFFKVYYKYIYFYYIT